MMYIELSILFLIKMAQIWLLPLIGLIVLLAITTKLKSDSSWLKRALKDTYRLLER